MRIEQSGISRTVGSYEAPSALQNIRSQVTEEQRPSETYEVSEEAKQALDGFARQTSENLKGTGRYRQDFQVNGSYMVKDVASIMNTDQNNVKSILKSRNLDVEDLIDQNKTSELSENELVKENLSSYSKEQKQILMENLQMNQEQFDQFMSDLKNSLGA